MATAALDAQRREREAAAQGSDPRPVDGCDWCGPGMKPGANDSGRCPTCRDLEKNHGWDATTYWKSSGGKVSYKKEGRKKRLNTQLAFIEASAQDLLAAAPANERDGSQGGGKMPAGEGEKGDADDVPAEEAQQKAGEGKKRGLEDLEDESEGEGEEKRKRPSRVSFETNDGGAGAGEDDECLLASLFANIDAYQRKLESEGGYSDEEVEAKVAERYREIFGKVVEKSSEKMLEFALSRTQKYKAEEVDNKLPKLNEEAREALTFVEDGEHDLEAWEKRKKKRPEWRVKYEERLVPEIEAQRTEADKKLDEMEALKGSVQEKYDGFVGEGKRKFGVGRHGTPEKAQQRIATARAEHFGAQGNGE